MRCPNILSSLSPLALGVLALALPAGAQVLFQDGFNYTAGSNLGANPPWGGGSSTNIQVGSANLTYAGLKDLGGNDLVMSTGLASTDTNIFSTTVVNSGSVYFSFLINATTLPTVNNYVAALNPGSAKPGGSTDTLSFYTGADGAGYKIGIRTSGGGSGATFASTMLNLDQTYLIVGEYSFGSFTANLFLDPLPGGTQPVTPDATQTGTLVSGGIEDVGVKSQSAASAGDYLLDNFIVGQSWSDVTPQAAPEPSTLALAALGTLALAARRFRKQS